MYNIGDKVKVRTDLTPGRTYGGLVFYAGKMAKTAGMVGTIVSIENGAYRLKGYKFLYSAEMLLPVDE